MKLYLHILGTLYLAALASAWCGNPIERCTETGACIATRKNNCEYIIEQAGKDPCSGNPGANKFCHGGICNGCRTTWLGNSDCRSCTIRC
ncbi:hypothetical protein PTMSG1_08471 [Pyrenophora teres f. maculata]|nr:hypothetical protein PTMSG1_08471 [Pyrenophora teres f. maculata]